MRDSAGRGRAQFGMGLCPSSFGMSTSIGVKYVCTWESGVSESVDGFDILGWVRFGTGVLDLAVGAFAPPAVAPVGKRVAFSWLLPGVGLFFVPSSSVAV